jgi:hypothetical protein
MCFLLVIFVLYPLIRTENKEFFLHTSCICHPPVISKYFLELKQMASLISFWMWAPPILLIHIISIAAAPFSVDFATKIIILFDECFKEVKWMK